MRLVAGGAGQENPMLTIEPPFYFINSLTIFRDHQDPTLFYFLPGLPRLAVAASRPQALTLYKYRRDLTDNPAMDSTRAKGAGLALFEVEIPPPVLGTLQSEVARQSGRSDARLVPVVFNSVDVHAIVAHADGDTLISDLIELHPAPLVSPHHAAFALGLTAEGAALFEAAAKGGALPVGVAYEMQFLALTPSLHARVRMNYAQIYDNFSASLGFTYYVSAKLDLEIASLVEHDLIHIEIVSFTDSADQDRQRALVMGLVTARIQRDFFSTGLPPSPGDNQQGGPLAQVLAGLGGGNKVNSASALFVLKARYDVVKQQRDFVLEYDSRTAIELTHGTSAFLSTMAKDGVALDVREIDLDDPFFSALEVQVTSVIDFAALADLRAATINFSFGDHRNSYLFSPTAAGPFRFAVALTNPAADQYQYDVAYDFDTDLGDGSARLTAGPFTSRNRVLVLDPLMHFRYRRVHFVLGPLDLARVPQVDLHVRIPGDTDGAPDLASADFVLNGTAREHLWRVHLPPGAAPLRLMVRSAWEDAQGVRHPGDETEIVGDAFVVLGPYRDLMSLMVQAAADWSKVNQVVAEIRYHDGDDIVDRQLTFSAAGKGVGQRVDIPLLDPAKRQYQWRQTFLNADGTSDTTDWATADYDMLIVGQRPKITGDVHIVWVGAPGDIFGLRVDLWARTATGDEQNVGVFMRAPAQTDATVTLPLNADGVLEYRFEVRKIVAAGEELIRSGAQQSNLLVVQNNAS
jgi:hypothetical protein